MAAYYRSRRDHAFVTEVIASESPDVDMAVGYDANGNGMPDQAEERCVSAARFMD